MFTSLASRRRSLILAGTLILVGSACSKGADQRPAADSGMSSAAVTSAGDSAATRDTAMAPGNTAAVAPEVRDTGKAVSRAAVVPVKPRVRPNIDPGRVTAEPQPVAAPDSSGSKAESTSTAA